MNPVKTFVKTENQLAVQVNMLSRLGLRVCRAFLALQAITNY